MGTPNQTLIQKADLALSELTSGGGKLQEDQVKEFWRVAILGSSFLKVVRTQPINGTEYEIPKAGLSGWVLAPGEERTKLTEEDRSKPDLAKTLLSTKTFKATISLSYEQVEENVEGGTFIDTVRQMLGEAAARDLAVICVQGDTAITATDKRTRSLKKLDGILKQATSNLFDADGSRFTKSVAESLYRKMPTAFRNQEGLAILTSTIAAHDYAAAQANRQTPLGDDMLSKMSDAKHGRFPIIGLESFPEDLGSGDKTNAILCNPKNIVIGMSKEITIEWDKDIDAGEFKIVARVKADVKFLHEPAVAKATNISAAP